MVPKLSQLRWWVQREIGDTYLGWFYILHAPLWDVRVWLGVYGTYRSFRGYWYSGKSRTPESGCFVGRAFAVFLRARSDRVGRMPGMLTGLYD